MPYANEETIKREQYLVAYKAQELFACVKDIFSAGKWNGDEYTEADLDAMVANYQKLKKEFPAFRVPLKVDLFRNTKDADKRHGGQPNVGIITDIKRIGKRLYAHIERIPKAVKEIIENGGYQQVSAEIAWNLKVGEEKLSRVLLGVALLGTELPGVHNLEEFAGFYEDENKDGAEFKTHVYEEKQVEGRQGPDQKSKQGGDTMPEIKELQDQLDKQAAELKKYKDEAETLRKENQALKDKEAKLVTDQKAAEIKVYVDGLVKAGKVRPADEAVVQNSLVKLEGEELANMKKFYEGQPNIVEFEEKTKQAEAAKKTEETSDEEILKEFKADPNMGDENGQKAHFLVTKYMERPEHKGKTYQEVYTVVAHNHPDLY